MAYTTLVAGTTITAAWANANVRDQVTTPFASAAARSSAISAPVEGMVSHLNDTNQLGVYSGAAWSSVGPVHGEGISWTPTCTQLGAVPLTVTRARYWRTGRMVTAYFFVSVSGAGGTGGNAVLVGPLPAAAHASAVSTGVGSGYIFDASAPGTFSFVASLSDATTLKFFATNSIVGDTRLGITQFVAALATSDLITATVTYEAAADA